MAHRPVLVLSSASLALALSLGAAACGSSSTSTSTSPPASSPTTTAAPSTVTVPAAVGDAVVPGPVPAVSGATDVTKEPMVAASTTPAPTVLTDHDLVVGTGATAAAGNTVKVQYVGAFYATGKVFDASWTDSGPTSFPLSGVVPGFRDAIIGMKIGGRREVVIPPAFGYGSQASGPIPANSTLVFVIDLLGVS